MLEYGTFSSLIDTAIARSLRRDRQADIISYARLTMRECAVMAFFHQDFVEEELTVNAVPFIWTRPQFLRQISLVQYPILTRHGDLVKPLYISPALRKSEHVYWYYLSGTAYVFSGLTVGQIIKIGYYSYQTHFNYIANVADRPAQFDIETGAWKYHQNYDDNLTVQETARKMVSNWMLFNWFDTIIEGTLAKLFKTLNDERSTPTYALYKSLQTAMLAGEAHVRVLE